jgi:hypothetical protein
MTIDPTSEPAPETVTDAVRFLETAGYRSDVTVEGPRVRCAACGTAYVPTDLVVSHTFRFEGETDPADEAIVLGVDIPSCGAKGIIVSAYGPDADPELLDLVAALTG